MVITSFTLKYLCMFAALAIAIGFSFGVFWLIAFILTFSIGFLAFVTGMPKLLEKLRYYSDSFEEEDEICL